MRDDHVRNDQSKDDTSYWSHICIPSSFVVLQGIAGDGLLNTMDTLPEFIEPLQNEGRPPTATPEAGNHSEATTTLNQILSSPLRLNMAGVSSPWMVPGGRPLTQSEPQRHNDSAAFSNTVVAVSEPEEGDEEEEDMDGNSFVVVDNNASSEDDTEPPTSRDARGSEDSQPIMEAEQGEASSQSSRSHQPETSMEVEETTDVITCYPHGLCPQQLQAIDEWTEQCPIQAKEEREDYLASREMSAEASRTRSSGRSPHKDTWWIAPSNGYLAVLDRLPIPVKDNDQDDLETSESTSRHEQFQANVIGHLAPGATVTATELYTLDSNTLRPIPNIVPKEDVTVNGTASTLFPIGRSGWIQLVKLELTRTQILTESSGGPSKPCKSGFAVLSVDGYSYLAPGLPSAYVDPEIWWWRVTCPVGAWVRQGLGLDTDHVATIPYGSLVQVKQKTINAMGLSRLQVEAFVPSEHVTKADNNRMQRRTFIDLFAVERIVGWCSEILNPRSGQQGPILRPLPFPVPAQYRVVLEHGAVIRTGVELSSPQIGRAPLDAVLTVTGRVFSETPVDRCIPRLRLAGNGGWISCRLNNNAPDNVNVVTFDHLDASFDPTQAGIYHAKAMHDVYEQQHRPSDNDDLSFDRGQSHGQAGETSLDVSSVEEGCGSDGFEPMIESIDTVDSAMDSPPRRTPVSADAPHSPRLSLYSAKACQAVQTHKETDRGNPCVICLSEERTATLVHGGTGHIVCCLQCARVLKAENDPCPVCRLPIDLVIQHFFA